MRNRNPVGRGRSALWLVLAGVSALGDAPVRGDATAAFSLAHPGSQWVVRGKPTDLEVRVTMDTRLAACRFDLALSGSAGGAVSERSLNPTGAAGMSYLSAISQDPFEDDLSHDLVTAGPLREVVMDLNPADGDGLEAGTGTLVETVKLIPSGTYGQTLILSLSATAAATTQGNPDGALFATVSAGSPVNLLITVQPDLDRDGDADGFDFLTFSNCYNGSSRPPAPNCQNPDADFDGDGDVDGFDFLTMSNCYNGSSRPPICP